MSENRKLWRDMQEPHENVEAVNAAIAAFVADLGELREKHRLADVTTIVRVQYLDAKGREVDAVMPHHFGDQMRMEAMTAIAYGQAVKERQEMIGHYLAGVLKQPKDQR